MNVLVESHLYVAARSTLCADTGCVSSPGSISIADERLWDGIPAWLS